ncbi:RagB/SusD family nutrient uptake outer membrane protein [uncultured Chryseobacterium sp.]|uniref:RagB/SusD family nutrient uptake outer membrane protein n=1 Tax=uncultured Chryseobacterium sp. TaxID=259322 RepID=UPI00258FFDEB|nr:RagB/SusD family nutrient uptake outer membrane protein [uncultured Chryseobacterium sp.]
MRKLIIIITSICLCYFWTGCSDKWLEEKQDIKLIVPTTIKDLDLLLNADVFQYDGRGSVETACDDYEFTPEQFNQLFYGFDRDLVIWKKDVDMENFVPVQFNEWKCAYQQIQICNVVLKRLATLKKNENNSADYNRIYGIALYHRSKQFLNLVMTFSKYYDKSSSKSDFGIPLKLDDGIDEVIKRASVEETYQRIVSDLRESARNLPVYQKDYSQVTKAGSFALLARTQLFMDNYEDARKSADSALKYNSFIQDFNQISNTSASRPLNIQSKEIHVRAAMVKVSNNPTTGRISQTLYNEYDNSDLRKVLFFKPEQDNKVTFKGHFLNSLFTGTTTGEVLLILAETEARLGNKDKALEYLNQLALNRYKKNTFVQFVANTNAEALDLILRERRKELVTRGLRWQDLKRLNRDSRYQQTLRRSIGENIYELPANDPRYVFPIPSFVTNFNHIEQN